ncbi:MAG: DNA polymerase/3'-5' exonuclease PolX [Nitrososphaeraceae archaeon]
MKTNIELSKLFRKIAYLMQVDHDTEKDPNAKFKIRAYLRAAETIENLSVDLEEIYQKNGIKGLVSIPSIGKAIALKIEEYIKNGKIQFFEELTTRIPINIDEFYDLEGIGIGPKTVKTLYENLNVRTLEDLEHYAKYGELRKVKGFSIKKEASILKKIKALKNVNKKRYLLGDIYPIAKTIENLLQKCKDVKKVAITGSFRRMRETIGDIDFLVESDNPDHVIEYFISLPQMDQIIAKGETKVFGRLVKGIDTDLLVVQKNSFGSALQYFTGNKEHNIELRKIALTKKYRLNEWGLFNSNGEKIAGTNEEEIYNYLGLTWIPPELRENHGEIEISSEYFSRKEFISNLVEYGSLKGDLQVHTESSDGTKSIEEMGASARDEFGLNYIAITDHTKSLKIANGLDENRLINQIEEINKINDNLKEKNSKNNFKILSSAEVEILKDGSLDMKNSILENLDIVGASIHSNFRLPSEDQTKRVIAALKNPHVDILFHPTGRIINKREGYDIDIDEVIEVAKDTKTVLEINAHYNRLDLKDEYVRKAINNNVKLAINSDAHHPLHFSFLVFGIGQARRGWAKQSDIINTLPVNEMLRNLK